jgi:fructose-bisphosphate aldolase class II
LAKEWVILPDKRESMNKASRNIFSLKQLLSVAGQRGFAVGAFSPRYTPLIRAVLQAAEATRSPVIVQIAQIELKWYQLNVEEFAHQFWLQLEKMQPNVPVGLHLDHTSDFALIQAAAANGFTSVMVDASALPLKKNIAETRRVVEYAHARGISVEAELGRIGSADLVETETDEELFTDPQEAAYFVEQTGIDALAVSVGTAHGVYRVRQPRIDLERLKAIRALTPVPLVLHGGSGTPLEMIRNAIHLPEGGVSKVNIATDLELALLKELGLKERTTDAGLRTFPPEALERGVQAVRQVVEDKIVHFLGSRDHATDYLKG